VDLVDPGELGLNGVAEVGSGLSDGLLEVFPCGSESNTKGVSLGSSLISDLGSQGVDSGVQVGSLGGEITLELLTASGKAVLRCISGDVKNFLEVFTGILNGGGKGLLGGVDLVKESLLVVVVSVTVVSFLELGNGAFNSTTLGGDISDKGVSGVSDLGLGVDGSLCETVFDTSAVLDKSVLEVGAAGLKGTLLVVFELLEPLLEETGSGAGVSDELFLDGWEVTNEVSVEEGLDLIVASEGVWVVGVWGGLVEGWVVSSLVAWGSGDHVVVSWVSLELLVLVVCGVVASI
jgi:hypothetical protein